MRALLVATLLVASATAMASPPPATQREIAGLFSTLERSGCRFARNGSWYDAGKARAHLQDKYNYLLRRDAITRTEDFIELAATRSSMSGRAYLVQCPGASAIESGPWFRNALVKLRSAH
ncbi:DUF5329 domain-containing protein [Cognatilysobacter lacus]|uniref:DUF5329 domain-containing protein n=1 Tax=Cognatilysobacter lacus TaxID=1643323 RepID=A0A5D8Z4D9_9GAMM|nr:DUF5329 domain-containing protein [Lysobacter lacus]TZF89788.1 hypothetical protein FW784_07905 [Lysobacter lacus]